MKKPITFSIIGIFIVLNILDIITTVYLYTEKNTVFNEINPVFILTKNFWLSLILMKLLVLFIVWIYYKYLESCSETIRYAIVAILVVMNLMMFTTVQANYNLIKAPEQTHAQITQYIQEETTRQNITEDKLKLNIYKETVAYPIFKSVFFIMLIFILFKKVEKENPKQEV